MNDLTGIPETMELLGRLQAAVRTASDRNAELERDFRNRNYRLQQAHDADIRKLEAEREANTKEQEDEHRAAREQCEARYQKRQLRIDSSYQQSLGRALQEIEQFEGQRKFKIQAAMLQTSRSHDADLITNKEAGEQFTAALSQNLGTIASLTLTAEKTFSGLASIPQPAATAVPSQGKIDEMELLAKLTVDAAATRDALDQVRRNPLCALFRIIPLPVWIVLLAVGHAGYGLYLQSQKSAPVPWQLIGTCFGGAVALLVLAYVVARQQAKPAAKSVGEKLAQLRQLHQTCAEAGARNQQQRLEDNEKAYEKLTHDLNREWKEMEAEVEAKRSDAHRELGDRWAGARELAERQHHLWLRDIEEQAEAERMQLKADVETCRHRLANEHQGRKMALTQEFETHWSAVDEQLGARAELVYRTFEAASARTQKHFPAWHAAFPEQWTAPEHFAHAAQFGRIDVDVEKLAGVVLASGRLKLPGPAKFSVPLQLALPRAGSLLLESAKTGHDEAIATLNDVILRLLSAAPSNRLNFSLVDPVGLGQSFAGITHLSDFGENLINGRIWTQPAQIEKRLAELNEHMEKVIQMYLRNEYETIAEYNEKAGTIAEKYHFLVVADFPVGFSEIAIKRLLSIAASGARCGVFTLIHWDKRQVAPEDFVADDLRKNSVALVAKGAEFVLGERFPEGVKLVLEPPPDANTVTNFIQKVGEESIRTNRVEVPFAQIVPAKQECWTLETTSELRIPIGRTGATKLQYLAIGQGTRQHALIAGKTGSGKSTLFHVVITNLALWCSPEQVEFYLVDFKKGVEFQCYAAHRLPHARVVAIESDREFGLSVLQRVDEELRRRGEMFRRLGVQDLAGYKKAGGTEPVPRSLLLIDEFQEFFVEDDRISQSAALLLDRIVRQGRAFGIHVLLGSQTLGGAYTLARATLGQMVIRIALQCNEADAYLIMDDNNPAPRLLSRPGEGIYNDMAGSIEGNSPFQTVWLSDDVRDHYLAEVMAIEREKGAKHEGPIVFEGNAPADVRQNMLLQQALAKPSAQAPATPRLWLGAPNSIKGPTEAAFHRQSGSNLLVIGQRDEAALSILSIGVMSVLAQHPRGAARVVVFDTNAPGSPERDFLERLGGAVPRDFTIARGAEIETVLNELAGELKSRQETGGASGAETFLFIHGLQRLKKLRFEEDFGFSGGGDDAPNPGKQLNDLICEGPAHGIHIIAIMDTYNNVNRFMTRKALTEFEMRVLFQMSANDSAALIDSQRASDLGLHRAVFYNEQEGYLEVFRPCSLPDGGWLEEAGRQLGQ